MPQVELTIEEAILLATRRVLPAGYKPEDYLIVGESFPKRIAIMVALEAQYLIKMGKLWK